MMGCRQNLGNLNQLQIVETFCTSLVHYERSAGHVVSPFIRRKNILDSQIEQGCHGEGQGERWIESALFDRDNGLPAHSELICKYLLRESMFGAQSAHIVFHHSSPTILFKGVACHKGECHENKDSSESYGNGVVIQKLKDCGTNPHYREGRKKCVVPSPRKPCVFDAVVGVADCACDRVAVYGECPDDRNPNRELEREKHGENKPKWAVD